jgi:hypothetical protein
MDIQKVFGTGLNTGKTHKHVSATLTAKVEIYQANSGRHYRSDARVQRGDPAYMEHLLRQI